MRKEVTCLCSVYHFPHRIGGGKCHGREWAESVYLYKSYNCEGCHCNTGTSCEVYEGGEEIEMCPEYQQRLEGKQAQKHPINTEELLETLIYENQHGEY